MGSLLSVPCCLLTFLSAALLGHVFFALVKWRLFEAETLFTFRFDRL